MSTQEFQLSELESDRVAMTLRPPGRSVMRQNWHDLLFLHWAVPPEQIVPLLPPGLDLDTYDGRVYVGLIPFTMTGVRPVWSPPVRGISAFHETNLRTYVHRRGRAPGVWFFSLDAANAAAVRIARARFKLPYHYARMSLTHEMDRESGETIAYASERRWSPVPAVCRVRCRPQGPVTPAAAGTLEHFLAERYLLYAYSGTQLYSGRVHHAPYPLQTAGVEALEETLIAAAGVCRPDTAPLAHYASGVRVHVFPLTRISEEI